MRPTLTAVIAAIEAVAVALTGIAVIAIPAFLLWIASFDMGAEPVDVLGAGAAVWLLAHFVPLGFSLPPETALTFGLPPETLSFTLSLAPLGVTLITVLLAGRSGWRFGRRGGMGVAGVIGGAAGFAGVAIVMVTLAGDTLALPHWLAILLPALCYAVASLTAFLVRAGRDEHPWWAATIRWKQRSLQRLNVPGTAALPARIAELLRIAVALLATFLGLAALAVTAAIIVGYVSITTLTQSLQLDGLGAFLLFLVQLALLPTAILWGGAWLTGAGFAVGAGSSASPFGALLGPMPALPLFGAIPQGWGSAGVLAPALLVVGGLVVGILFARRSELRRSSWPIALGLVVAASAVTALAVAGLTALATGSIGPDRLASVGPDPWPTAGLAAAELGVGALIGVLASRMDTSRVRASVADLLPERVSSQTSDARTRKENPEDAQFDWGHEPVDMYETTEISEISEISEFAETAEVQESAEALETAEMYETIELHETVEITETTQVSETVEVYETAEIHETAEVSETIEDHEPVEIPEPADTEEDELLRAYAWDGTESVDPEPTPEPRRTGWRLPRKGR